MIMMNKDKLKKFIYRVTQLGDYEDVCPLCNKCESIVGEIHKLYTKADEYSCKPCRTAASDAKHKKYTQEHHARTVHTVENKTGRNDPCHCGSKMKYKKCCGAI